MKVKDRILNALQNKSLTATQLQAVVGAPMGSITGRATEMVKAGVLTYEGPKNKRLYVLKTGAPVSTIIEVPTSTKTHVILVIDKSGSIMDSGLTDDMINVANAMLDPWRKADADVTRYQFAYSVYSEFRQVSAGVAPALHRNAYHPSGGTALRSAIGQAIEEAGDDGVSSYLFNIITDGYDNAYGQTHEWADIEKLLKEKQATGRFTFAFIGPNLKNVLKDKVPEGNIREWNASEGTKELEREVKTSGAAFAQARTRGTRSTKQYFQADLSKVTVTDFERDLTEITPQIRRWLVTKETTIEDLIKSKTGSYEAGTGFFEIMKREGRIKGDRKFILLNPTTGRVFADGKKTVRAVCGYPEGDFALKPGNHAGFVLLCQSKSSTQDTFRARILPRGTSVVLWPNAGR